jgi:hypothetical protein
MIETQPAPPLLLLLAGRSPCLRWLALGEWMGGVNRSDSYPLNEDCPAEIDELAALRERDPLVAPLLAAQDPDGAWRRGDLAWQGDASRLTTLALMRLGYLGFGSEHPAVAAGAAYLFSQQRPDGAWGSIGLQDDQESESSEGYSMVPLQTALPLRALAMCGYATDPRAELAYAWLLDQRLDDGAWPTGKAGAGSSGVSTYGYVAGYRKMPHSRWGCRSNTTGGLLCLAHHPERRAGPEARRALDLLLGRETRETGSLGFEVARLTGAVPTRGFMTFYGRFDLAQILDLCWRIGATLEDDRVAGIVAFVGEQQGPYGLWDVEPPQASRWVTFDLLRSLSRLDASGEWISHEPRTPFQTYPKRARRY